MPPTYEAMLGVPTSIASASGVAEIFDKGRGDEHVRLGQFLGHLPRAEQSQPGDVLFESELANAMDEIRPIAAGPQPLKPGSSHVEPNAGNANLHVGIVAFQHCRGVQEHVRAFQRIISRDGKNPVRRRVFGPPMRVEELRAAAVPVRGGRLPED